MEYKEYILEQSPLRFVTVKYNGRGTVHLNLRGKYSNYSEAIRAIDRVNKPKRVRKNGKTKASS